MLISSLLQLLTFNCVSSSYICPVSCHFHYFFLNVVERMRTAGLQCLRDQATAAGDTVSAQAADALLADSSSPSPRSSGVLLGFHVPPFNSINHLHLHVISPVPADNPDSGIFSRYAFRSNTWWFSTVCASFLLPYFCTFLILQAKCSTYSLCSTMMLSLN